MSLREYARYSRKSQVRFINLIENNVMLYSVLDLCRFFLQNHLSPRQ